MRVERVKIREPDRRARLTVTSLQSLLLTAAIACVLVLCGMFFLQDRLLYFPGRATVDSLATDGLKAWPSPEDFRGLVAEPPGEARGTVVVFHGNAGHVGHRTFYVEALAPLGWRVLLTEYPAYGPRAGVVGEESLVGDAEETVSRALTLSAGVMPVRCTWRARSSTDQSKSSGLIRLADECARS